VGYYYDSAMVKNELTYYGYVDSTAYDYSVDNGFPTNLLNQGSCGDDMIWHYNLDTNTLTISGSGDMYKFSSATSVPWYDYMSSINSIVIGDDVNSVSIYSFYNASNVTDITMPLSLSAPTSQNVWYGCSKVKKIKLTYGTGYMADYGTNNSSKVYTYTPWYISRDSITMLSIDSDVKYIGSYAFRDCNAVKTLTLNDCDSIGKYAFYDCNSIVAFINYNKDTAYYSNCLFKYSESKEQTATVYGYDDSTTKDYADANGVNFVSLGCEHSREIVGEGERSSCCYDSNVVYSCNDCGEQLYNEYVYATSNGHYVKATVKTTEDKAIPNAEVYIDGELSAITNDYGKFVVDEVKCEINHTVEIKKHGYTIATATVNTNKSNRNGVISIQYGNFVVDGAVNAKDYAYALKNGFDDIDLIDYGKITNDNFVINTKYSKQSTPTVTNIYAEQNPAKKNGAIFYVDVNFGSDYIVEDCGFIYGKNMEEDMLTLDNVGKANDDGYKVKLLSTPLNNNTKAFNYSSSTAGTLTARFYITYSNGVKSYTYYSDMCNYIISSEDV
jgi:hypothetical protein